MLLNVEKFCCPLSNSILMIFMCLRSLQMHFLLNENRMNCSRVTGKSFCCLQSSSSSPSVMTLKQHQRGNLPYRMQKTAFEYGLSIKSYARSYIKRNIRLELSISFFGQLCSLRDFFFVHKSATQGIVHLCGSCDSSINIVLTFLVITQVSNKQK